MSFVRSFFEQGKPVGVTSRKPDDLEAFSSKVIEEIAEGIHEEQAEKTLSA